MLINEAVEELFLSIWGVWGFTGDPPFDLEPRYDSFIRSVPISFSLSHSLSHTYTYTHAHTHTHTHTITHTHTHTQLHTHTHTRSLSVSLSSLSLTHIRSKERLLVPTPGHVGCVGLHWRSLGFTENPWGQLWKPQGTPVKPRLMETLGVSNEALHPPHVGYVGLH